MSDDIGTELSRIAAAFDKPTLRLLDRKWAPLVLAVFRSSFSRDRQSIPAERLHLQVDAYLGDLRSLAVGVPEGTGRSLCMQWMRDQWLYRALADDGGEVYSLTSHALEALSLVDSLTHDRALISQSRLTTILETVRRWATEANPDRQDRIRRLEQQITALSLQRDRLTGGEEVLAATDDQMVDGYSNLVDLISQLPGDFKRVEEALVGMHRQIITAFREETRPMGEVVSDYMTRSDDLVTETPEGRAFDGALTILRDNTTMAELKSDLQRIMDHPFAEALTAAEIRDFVGTVNVLRRGLTDVLGQRKRLSSTLRDNIASHNQVKERELDEVLRGIGRQLAIWMQTARPRAAVPVGLMPASLDVEHLRLRFYDPEAERPPARLEDVSGQAPPPPSLEEIRRYGGPLLTEVREGVLTALDVGAGSMGAAFNQLNRDLRRPVEILGLLQTATQVDALAGTEQVEVFRSVRPDGTGREFLAPWVVFDSEQIAIIRRTYGDEGDDGW